MSSQAKPKRKTVLRLKRKFADIGCVDTIGMIILAPKYENDTKSQNITNNQQFYRNQQIEKDKKLWDVTN